MRWPHLTTLCDGNNTKQCPPRGSSEPAHVMKGNCIHLSVLFDDYTRWDGLAVTVHSKPRGAAKQLPWQLPGAMHH